MSSVLTVTAYGLKGADAAQFSEIAKEAEAATRCQMPTGVPNSRGRHSGVGTGFLGSSRLDAGQ